MTECNVSNALQEINEVENRHIQCHEVLRRFGKYLSYIK